MVLLFELLQLDVGFLKFLLCRLLVGINMICVVDGGDVVDIRWDMRRWEDVIGDFRSTFGQVTFGFVTLFLLANALGEVILRINFGVKMADAFGEGFWT